MKKIYLLLVSMVFAMHLISQTTKEESRGGCPTYLPNNYTFSGTTANVDVSVYDSTWYPYYLHWSPLNDPTIVNVSDTLYSYPDTILQIIDLAPGVKYLVKTRDKWMCGSWDTIQSPCIMNATFHKVAIPGLCDSIWYDVQGGTGPYTLSVWFNGTNGPYISEHPTSPFGKPDYCNADYEVIITDANGCTDTLRFNPSLVSVNDVSSDIEFNMYPNPAEKLLVLKAKETFETIKVMDVSGRVIIDRKTDSGNVQLDISGLNAGVYVVQTNSRSGMAVQRFIKK